MPLRQNIEISIHPTVVGSFYHLSMWKGFLDTITQFHFDSNGRLELSAVERVTCVESSLGERVVDNASKHTG